MLPTKNACLFTDGSKVNIIGFSELILGDWILKMDQLDPV